MVKIQGVIEKELFNSINVLGNKSLSPRYKERLKERKLVLEWILSDLDQSLELYISQNINKH